MSRAKAVFKALLIAATLAVPVGLASPAQAITSNGCTVTPLTPYHNGEFSASGIKRIRFDMEVTCEAGLTITIDQERWEYDPNNADEFTGDYTWVRSFDQADTRTYWFETNLSDTDDFTDHYEEVYQRIRFKVTSGPVTSAWTGWDYSGTRSIHT